MQGKERGERKENQAKIWQEVLAINSAHSCDLSFSSTMCITLETRSQYRMFIFLNLNDLLTVRNLEVTYVKVNINC
jgi:hypothetical protein